MRGPTATVIPLRPVRSQKVDLALALAMLNKGVRAHERAERARQVATAVRRAQLMQPLAVGVIGGFVLSGPIVLLVLPSLYRLLDPAGRLAGEE